MTKLSEGATKLTSEQAVVLCRSGTVFRLFKCGVIFHSRKYSRAFNWKTILLFPELRNLGRLNCLLMHLNLVRKSMLLSSTLLNMASRETLSTYLQADLLCCTSYS